MRTYPILALGLLLALSLWAGMSIDSWLPRWVAAASGIALAAFLVHTLSQRIRGQPSARSLHSRGFWMRLGLFFVTITLLAGVGTSVLMCYLRANALVHPGRLPVDRKPETVGINAYQEVAIQSTDGLVLRGWYIPSHNGAAVVFVHGQGGNRTAFLKEAALMNQLGYGGLLIDLRNQGESDGTVTTLGLREADDVIAAVRFVQQQQGVEPGRVALVGQSMGGAAALIAAAKLPEVRGLVDSCSFTSLGDNIEVGVYQMGLPVYPFAPLIVFFGQLQAGIDINQVRPVDSLAAYRHPLLIIHGGQDRTIPVENAYALFAAAREPKSLYIIPQAGHCDFGVVAGETYENRLVDFLQSALR